MKQFIHGAFSSLAILGAFQYGMLFNNNLIVGWTFAAAGFVIALIDRHQRNL